MPANFPFQVIPYRQVELGNDIQFVPGEEHLELLPILILDLSVILNVSREIHKEVIFVCHLNFFRLTLMCPIIFREGQQYTFGINKILLH